MRLRVIFVQVGKKGRSITLKLMVRADGAAEETSKFLGHGVCDNLSRSSQLLTGTDSADLILREVVSLAKAVGINSDQWRGVGVSIARLEDRGEANQSLLRFLTKGKKEAEKEGQEVEATEFVNNNAERTVNPKIEFCKAPTYQTVCEAHLDGEDGEEKPDPTFLAALPPDIRAEVEAQFRQSRAQSEIEEARIQQEQHGSIKSLEMVQTTPNEGVEKRSASTLSSETETCSNGISEELQAQKASPTQLDPQFMAELPADIREELEEYERERKRTKVEKEEEVGRERERTKVEETERVSPAEASFSQLDPDVRLVT